MTKNLAAKIAKQIDLTIAMVTQGMIEEVIAPADGRTIIDSLLDGRSVLTEKCMSEVVVSP